MTLAAIGKLSPALCYFLLEQVFDGLTQLKRLKLKTNIQRGDSFLAAANITHYSRLKLLIEVLRRLHRILSDSDKVLYAELFGPYLKKISTNSFG